MATINYTQFGLAPLPDFGLELGTDARSIVFEVSLSAKDHKIVLTYRDRDTGADYIAIDEDCFVTILLKGDQLFLSKDYEAITTKEELSSYYGGLEYGDYCEEYDRYKYVQFRARYNKGGKHGTLHPFNINVDLLQEDEDGTVRWIGLSIDPDITNPPPVGH